MTLHTYTPNQCPHPVSTSYTLWFPWYSPDKIFKLKETTARSKVKSRSHHDVAHLHPLTNVPTKYQLPTPYGFSDTARTNFSRRPPAARMPACPSGHNGWKQYPDSPYGLWGKKLWNKNHVRKQAYDQKVTCKLCCLPSWSFLQILMSDNWKCLVLHT